jgi:hypothetical protein
MSVTIGIVDTTTGNMFIDQIISSVAIFEARWLPLGEKLGLASIPLYAGSLVARQGETEPIIRDLHTLRGYLDQHQGEPDADYMIYQIGRLITRLEEIEANPNLEGWFG